MKIRQLKLKVIFIYSIMLIKTVPSGRLLISSYYFLKNYHQREGSNSCQFTAISKRKEDKLKIKWHQHSHNLWKRASCDNDGVMSGRADLNGIDIENSRLFLKEIILKRSDLKLNSAIDCGAGIGRISQHLLKNIFTNVDMVEKCQHFVTKARECQPENGYRHFYCCGLEQFQFSLKYDCIWVQWVLTHLHQDQVIDFLGKAKKNLNEGGVIIVKENVSNSMGLIDKQDCSIVRTTIGWRSLFYQAKFKILKEISQPNWPQELYSVNIWALI